MKVLAYCAQSFANTVRKASGVEPITSPPYTADNILTQKLEDYHLLYFDLHGTPGGTCWDGDDGVRALCTRQISALDLTGTIVYTASCYVGPRDPMTVALLNAGARVVIGGSGANWEYPVAMAGISLLGMWIRRLLSLHFPIQAALALAKARVLLGRHGRTKVAKDAAAFTLIYPEVV